MVAGARAARASPHPPSRNWSHCNHGAWALGRLHATKYGVLMRLPSECRNMAELRLQIDRLDRQLIALLAERAAYIDRATQLKPIEGLPARIDSRVNMVKANVRAQASTQGLDPELAESLWTQLIDWSIAREEKILGHDKQE